MEAEAEGQEVRTEQLREVAEEAPKVLGRTMLAEGVEGLEELALKEL